jgi:hypothetical protein
VAGQTIDEKGDPNVLRWKRRAMEFTHWTMFGCLTESTLFVEKRSFLAAGGFDERFGPGATNPVAEGAVGLPSQLPKSLHLICCTGDFVPLHRHYSGRYHLEVGAVSPTAPILLG